MSPLRSQPSGVKAAAGLLRAAPVAAHHARALDQQLARSPRRDVAFLFVDDAQPHPRRRDAAGACMFGDELKFERHAGDGPRFRHAEAVGDRNAIGEPATIAAADAARRRIKMPVSPPRRRGSNAGSARSIAAICGTQK